MELSTSAFRDFRRGLGRCRWRPSAEPADARPIAGRRGRPTDVQQGRRADSLQALHDLPSARRDRADVAADLRGGAALGPRHSRQRRQRHDAALARGSGARQVAQRPPADRRRRRTSSRAGSTAGAPRGQPEGPAASARLRARAGPSASPTPSSRWTKEYAVPAQGEIPYQYFEMPTNFTEDKWMQALEMRPGNRAVVHHVLVYARSPQMTRPAAGVPAAESAGADVADDDEGDGRGEGESGRQQQACRAGSRGPLIAQIAPGTPPTVFAPGHARCWCRPARC